MSETPEKNETPEKPDKSETTVTPDLKKSRWTVKRIAILIIFIALSAVGSLVRIPSPFGTTSLDSCPGFFSALAFGYAEGAIVIAIGHLLSSGIVGFPLSLPVHLVIAVGMAIVAILFRFIAIKLGRNTLLGLIIAAILGSILNVASGAMVVPFIGWGVYVAIIPMLSVAAVINVVIAAVAYFSVRNTKLLARAK